MENISIKRLEMLKDAMLFRYLDEIDFNSEKDRITAYEKLLHKTIIEGEFDNILLSRHLEQLDISERTRILNLSSKYSSLCFYHEDFDNWLDSVEGVTLSEPNLIAEILLNNYDYLIRLAKNGGEKLLKFLNKFPSDSEFRKGSVIALLRPGTIENEAYDDILESTLIELSKEDGKYKDFTDTQKIIMCDNLENVLFRKNGNGQYESIPVDELKSLILGEDSFSIKDIDSTVFRDIIEGIHVNNT